MSSAGWQDTEVHLLTTHIIMWLIDLILHTITYNALTRPTLVFARQCIDLYAQIQEKPSERV